MKSIKILIMFFCIILILSHDTFAIGSIFDTGEDWLSTGIGSANIALDTHEIKGVSSSLYNLLLAIATATAIIIGAILGIQFMTAGIDKRVQVKESLFPYMISCVVVFGALGIWRLVVMIIGRI